MEVQDKVVIIPQPDTAEDVAHKILEAAVTEPAEMGMPMQR